MALALNAIAKEGASLSGREREREEEEWRVPERARKRKSLDAKEVLRKGGGRRSGFFPFSIFSFFFCKRLFSILSLPNVFN